MSACKCGNTQQLLQGPFATQLCRLVQPGQDGYPEGSTGPQIVCIGGGNLVASHPDASATSKATAAAASSTSSINPATVAIEFAKEDGSTPPSFANADPLFKVNGVSIHPDKAFSLYKDLKLFDSLLVDHIVQICMAYDSPSDADIKSLENKYPEIYNPWEKAPPSTPQDLISFLHKSDPYGIHHAFAAASTSLRTIAKYRVTVNKMLAIRPKIAAFIDKINKLSDRVSAASSAHAGAGSSSSFATSASASMISPPAFAAGASAAAPVDLAADHEDDKASDADPDSDKEAAASAAGSARPPRSARGQSSKKSASKSKTASAASAAADPISTTAAAADSADPTPPTTINVMDLIDEAVTLFRIVWDTISEVADPSSNGKPFDVLTTSVLNLLAVPLGMQGANLIHPIIKKYRADRAVAQSIPLLRSSKTSPTDPPEVVGNGDWLMPFLFDCANAALPIWKRRILQDGRDLSQHLTFAVDYTDKPGLFTDFKTALVQIGFWHTMSSRSPSWLSFSEQYFNHLRASWDNHYETRIANGDNLGMWNSLMRYHTTLRAQTITAAGAKRGAAEDDGAPDAHEPTGAKVTIRDCSTCHTKFPVPPGRTFKNCSRCHAKLQQARSTSTTTGA